MKTILGFTIAILSFSAHAVTIQCTSADGNPKKAFVKGELTDKKGTLVISGDDVFFNTYEKETIGFNRQIRANEDSFSFAKFSGGDGSLFHFFYLSLPKQVFTNSTTEFPAYLSYLREGVGGMGEVKLSCQTFAKNPYMQDLISRHRNIITYDDLTAADQEKVKLVTKYEELPKKIQAVLNELKLSIVVNEEPILSYDRDFSMMINFSDLGYQNDALEVTEQGQTVGYAFNVTECNPEECYGWDALYLDAAGNILFKSF